MAFACCAPRTAFQIYGRPRDAVPVKHPAHLLRREGRVECMSVGLAELREPGFELPAYIVLGAEDPDVGGPAEILDVAAIGSDAAWMKTLHAGAVSCFAIGTESRRRLK